MIKEKTLLIILTYKYPYDPPIEQFLDDEIYYLNNDKTDILIVPNSRRKGKITYPFIEGRNNVHICEFKRKSLIEEAAIGFFYLFKNRSYVKQDLREIADNVSYRYKNKAYRWMIKNYIQGGAIYQELVNQIPNEYIANRKKIIMYSYWFNTSVIAESLYKIYLQKSTSANVVAFARAHGDGDLYVEGMDYFRPCQSIINKEIDSVFPISDNGNKRLKEQGIKNTETFRLGVKSRTEYVDCVNKIPLIVSCSVINDNKRVEKIAEILSHVNKNVRWVHFGGGPNEENLKKICTQKLPLNIQWKIAGWTDHEEIMRFYEEKHPDLFINVSEVEGIPVSIMEAMSYSIPCVATNVGASSEIVCDKQNGFLLDIDFDPTSSAKIISDYLSEEKEIKLRMRKNAYQSFQMKYNADVNYRIFSNRILAGDDSL